MDVDRDMGKVISSFDIIGPVMVGPSSSHTAGAVRLGNAARCLLGEKPRHASIYLHGSFWDTYQGHGTDLALVAGLLGFGTDDERIVDAFKLAREGNLSYSFFPLDLGNVHPNSVKIELDGCQGVQVKVQGSSIGGGSIVITEINELPVEIYGELNTIVAFYQDKPGVIAQITNVLAANCINIAAMRVTRQAKGAIAILAAEIDQDVSEEILDQIAKISAINSVRNVLKKR